MQALTDDDAIVATYREHGHALVRGVPAGAVMAEMFGTRRGLQPRARRLDAPVRREPPLLRRQRDRRRWPAARRSGWRSPTGCRGAHRVTACFFGEGAVAEGEFHESMNLAALWRLPVLFCCENNLYAMGTALSRSESETELTLKAASYEVPAWSVDGMDVLAVEDAAHRAAAMVRDGDGAGLPRAAHLPLPRALDVRPRPLPHQGGDRALEAARSDRRADRARCARTAASTDDELAELEAEVAAELGRGGRVRRGRARCEPVEELERFVHLRGAR